MEDYLLNNLLQYFNTISIFAARENAVETQKLARRIIDSLRYRYTRENQVLTLGDELAAVDNVIELYHMRFRDILNYIREVDNVCLNYYIPHYSILTFIENCIYHAFENKEGVREIVIAIKKADSKLEVTIKDNGCGFDYNKLTSENPKIKRYGNIIYAVANLNSQFKCEDIVQIESILEKGTTVSINIPL